MKVLKYILAAIAIIVLAFFAIGIVIPEVEYGHKITVNKSINEAWDVSQDESKFHLWLDGFKSIELLEGEKGQVGSKYLVKVNPGEGQPEFEMTETLVAIEQPTFVEMHFDSEMMDFEQKMLFKKENGAVTVETKSKVIGKSASMRSMFALMELLGGSFTTQEAKNINALQKVIEEG